MSDGRTREPAIARPFERGIWSLSGHAESAAALTELGFDWVCLDGQHGRFDDATIGATLAGRRRDSIPVHVRVLSLDAGLIGRALDAGAAGVIVPMVNTAEDAAALVDAGRYPPQGQRSWGPFLGAYDRDVATPATANATVRLSAMIETATGLANANDIAGTPGIDALFVGPFDLAIALGLALDDLLADTSASSPLRVIVEAAERAGIVAGAFAGTPERAEVLRSHGFSFVAVATDGLLLQLGAAAALA